MLKAAIIGCGKIANDEHMPAYAKSELGEVKYFCDIIPERADAAVKKYGVGKAVYDYKEILNDPEVTAVSVCTPNKEHKTIAIDFLKAGKNVLCEKPAARTYAEALEMQKVQHETGKVLNIGVVNRFNTAVNMIKKHIDAGDLGEVYQVYVDFRAHRSIPGLGGDFTTHSVAGGGVLIDWGVHYLDLVMYCTGDPQPKTVTGQAHQKLGTDMRSYVYDSMWAGPPKYDGTYDVEDFITGMVRTEGPTITLNGAWAQNIGEPGQYIDFIGTKAGIRLQYGQGFTVYGTQSGVLVQGSPKFTAKHMFQEEIDSFLRCITTGEKLPSHIDTVVITAKIMQGLYDSSEQGKEIVF